MIDIEDRLYHYKAFVRSVYDGDTIRADIDLGMFVTLENQPVRLYGIDTPEIRKKLERSKAIEARDALRSLILERTVVIRTLKDDKEKYGRWLGEIWLGDVNVNAWMVGKGHAKYYMVGA